jgi:hypothetical protein
LRPKSTTRSPANRAVETATIFTTFALMTAPLQFRVRRTEHRSGPELRHAIVTENNGVRGVGILNEIGDQAVIANSEPGGQRIP